MSRNEVPLNELLQLQRDLAKMLIRTLDENDKQFLISLKRGHPEWGSLGIPHVAQLPGVQWKLINIRKMNPAKHETALNRLITVLSQ